MHANYEVCCGLVWFTFLFGKGLRNGNPVLLQRAIAKLVESLECYTWKRRVASSRLFAMKSVWCVLEQDT